MKNFKPGDQVKCIDNAYTMNLLNLLYKGSIYTILSYDHKTNAVQLKYTSGSFVASKFELVEPIEYEIINPFNSIDIYDKDPCKDAFKELLRDLGYMLWPVHALWKTINDVNSFKTLKNNLPWLEKKGFIRKKEREYPWVNIYEHGFGTGRNPTYDSAKDYFDSHHESGKYVTTIQLKPYVTIKSISKLDE